MFIRFLKKYRVCCPLIAAVFISGCTYLIKINMNLHLRYVPMLITIWIWVISLILLTSRAAAGIYKLFHQKEDPCKSAHINVSIVLSCLFFVAGLFYTIFVLQPEREIEKYNTKMVAHTDRGTKKYTYYYEYVNALFYGQYLGVECYGSSLDNSDIPIEWEFYDKFGNLIDKGSYNEKYDFVSERLEEDPSDIPPNDILTQETELKKFNIDIMENREKELVFSISIDDYIDCYNGYYWQDNFKRYLLPSKEWKTWTEETSIHSEHETRFYFFTEDEKRWPLPTIKVYAPTNADYIQEININFDWHSYTASMYDLYKEMCFYTLKVFFPDFSDEQIISIYSKAIDSGYDHVFPSDEWYSSDSVPYAVFYKDNIAVYSYFAIGSSQSLCIIPVTQETINTLRQKGAEIYEIL